MRMARKVLAMTGLALALGASPARADNPDLSAYASAAKFFASGNSVTINFLYSLASADNELWLFASVGSATTQLISIPGWTTPGTPGSGTPLSVVINGLTPGDEVFFGICTTNVGGDPAGCDSPLTAFYMGAGSNNLDGTLHAAILDAGTWNGFGVGGTANPGSTVLGFENREYGDLYYDGDFNDVVFSIEGVAVPEPATMGLMAFGLVGLSGAGFIRRRRRN